MDKDSSLNNYCSSQIRYVKSDTNARLAQQVRASSLHGEGHWFKSSSEHHRQVNIEICSPKRRSIGGS